jgi:hypothetical protein
MYNQATEIRQEHYEQHLGLAVMHECQDATVSELWKLIECIGKKVHIGLVNPRWYIDDVSLANAETEPTISATGEVENSMAVPILINALKASHGKSMWKPTSEKRSAAKRYTEIFGKCREVSKLSCELEDDRLLHYLDELLLDLLQKKEN